jgi:hypothetical protein
LRRGTFRRAGVRHAHRSNDALYTFPAVERMTRCEWVHSFRLSSSVVFQPSVEIDQGYSRSPYSKLTSLPTENRTPAQHEWGSCAARKCKQGNSEVAGGHAKIRVVALRQFASSPTRQGYHCVRLDVTKHKVCNCDAPKNYSAVVMFSPPPKTETTRIVDDSMILPGGRQKPRSGSMKGN